MKAVRAVRRPCHDKWSGKRVESTLGGWNGDPGQLGRELRSCKTQQHFPCFRALETDVRLWGPACPASGHDFSAHSALGCPSAHLAACTSVWIVCLLLTLTCVTRCSVLDAGDTETNKTWSLLTELLAQKRQHTVLREAQGGKDRGGVQAGSQSPTTSELTCKELAGAKDVGRWKWGWCDGEWPFEQRDSTGKDRLTAEQERLASTSVWAEHRVEMGRATETSWRGGVGASSEEVLGCLPLAQCRHL